MDSGMISENKTTRDTSELQKGCNNLKVSWEKKRNEKFYCFVVFIVFCSF